MFNDSNPEAALCQPQGGRGSNHTTADNRHFNGFIYHYFYPLFTWINSTDFPQASHIHAKALHYTTKFLAIPEQRQVDDQKTSY